MQNFMLSVFSSGKRSAHKQVSSSIGRVVVSKTIGCGFESLLACHRILPGLHRIR